MASQLGARARGGQKRDWSEDSYVCRTLSDLLRRARGPQDRPAGDAGRDGRARLKQHGESQSGSTRMEGRGPLAVLEEHILGRKPRETKQVRTTSHSVCPRVPGPTVRFKWAVWALSGEKIRTGFPRPSLRTGPADTGSPGVETGRVAGIRDLHSTPPEGTGVSWGPGTLLGLGVRLAHEAKRP